MNYLCNKKVFATIQEANGYANLIMKHSKQVLIVTQINRKITHVFDFSKANSR